MKTEIFSFNVPHEIAPECKDPFYIDITFMHSGIGAYKIIDIHFKGHQLLFVRSAVDLITAIDECITEKLEDYYEFQKNLN